MKKLSTFLLLLFLGSSVSASAKKYPRGDLDLNNQVDIQDLSTLIDYLLVGSWPDDSIIDDSEVAGPYEGSLIAVIGDSFTASGEWFNRMCANLGATAGLNTARSGAAWCNKDESLSAYKQAQEMASFYSGSSASPDVILVVMGVNDINNDNDFYRFATDKVDLGRFVYTSSHDGNEVASLDLTGSPYSFTAGIQATLITLKKSFPNAIIKIGFTPSGMQYIVNGFRYPTDGFDPAEVLEKYLKRIEFCAHQYGVQYIDTLSCGISWWLTEDWNQYIKSSNDNHPSAAGMVRIADYMSRLLLNNL